METLISWLLFMAPVVGVAVLIELGLKFLDWRAGKS